MGPDREEVERSIWEALAPHGLDACTDGAMDTLDMVVEWAEEE